MSALVRRLPWPHWISPAEEECAPSSAVPTAAASPELASAPAASIRAKTTPWWATARTLLLPLQPDRFFSVWIKTRTQLCSLDQVARLESEPSRLTAVFP